ncbi:MAG: hypothetical protein A3G87_07535 [Omnitrophica bacterium RIFCSPLOWO2_12_FULL_50_11]|nr:MAG: hypothetical protein A3G87_07535 [Omnitrophica bacterium RIFCSPLOWO2_12_FULL_50_11]
MHPVDLSRVRRILVTRIDRIGDVILSTPVFQAIKKRFPKSYVAALVLEENEVILHRNPWIDQVIVYDKKGSHKNWWRTAQFGFGLKRYGFDAAIHLHPTNRVHLISYFAQIPIRIGYRRKIHSVLTHMIEEKKWQGAKHEAEYNFDLLVLIDVPKPERFELFFGLDVQEKERLRNLFRTDLGTPYVVFHPSASCPSKIWLADRFGAVADALAAQDGMTPVIIGEGRGVDDAEKMQKSMQRKAVNLAGTLSLGMLGWLLKDAELLVSNDSGPVHVASALGTPVISIFGRNQGGLSANRWKPFSARASFLQKEVGCIECLAHDCQINFKCLNELTVKDVLGEVGMRLNKTVINEPTASGGPEESLHRHCEAESQSIADVSAGSVAEAISRSRLLRRRCGPLSRNDGRLKRVLIVHPFGIGDALFITPSIRALKEHGVAEIDLLLGSRTKELFQFHPLVRRIFVWDKSHVRGFGNRLRRIRNVAVMFRTLWSNRYQVLIDCSLAHQYAFFGWILWWIPVRLGFNFRRRGIFLTHKVELPEAFKNKPVPEYYLDLLAFFGVKRVPTRLELFLSAADTKEAEIILNRVGMTGTEPYFVVAPAGGDSWGKDARLKRWPPSHFASLVGMLRSEFGAQFERVLILGGAHEKSIGDQLLEKLNGFEAYNLCGAAPIRTTAALIQKASFLLGNDSGLVHIAHTLGTPVIALYGPVNPLVYGPYPKSQTALTITNTGPECRPCYRKMRYQADCVGIECLTELEPEQVLDRIRAESFFEQTRLKVATQC